MNLGDAVLHFKGDNKDLEEKTSNLSSTLKSTLGGIGKTIGATFTTAFATASGMMVSLTKKAIDSYAEYEQVFDGMKAMFGDMEQGAEQITKVQEKAKKSWKDLTMSQNEYYRSFNSTYPLIKSSIDDENEAIDTTNRMLQLESDLANTFGYSIENASNAVNWALKGSFNYIDNLNLGIKGTQEGFLEAAHNCGYMVESVNELTSGQILDILEQYADKFGVLGRTANEASQTIQGSIKSLKASFDDFLNGSGGVDEVIDSVIIVFNNVIDALIKLAPNLADGLVTLVNGLLPKIPDIVKKTLPAIIKGIFDLTKGILSELPTIVETLISMVIEVANQLAEELPTLIPMIIDAIIDGILTLLDNIDVVIECGLKLILGLIQGISNALPTLVEKAPEINEKLISGIISSIGMIIEYAPQIIVALVQGLIGALGKIFEVGGKIVSKLWDGIKSMFGQLWQWIKELPSNILTWIKDGLSGIFNIGVDLIKGLWNGIKSVTSWIWDKISGFFSGIVNKIKGFFGIGSPSRLFADEIGQWLPKGLAVGIDANTDSVQHAIDDMNDIVASSFDLQPDITSLGSTYSPETIVNVYNNMEVDPLGQVVSSIKTFSGGAKNDFNYGGGIA